MTGSWKTTTAAAASAFFGFVLFTPESFVAYPWLIALSKYAFLGGLVAFGISAKDFDRTGK